MKFESMKIVAGMKVFYPVYEAYEDLRVDVADNKAYEHYYTANNGVMVYIDNGERFVTPITKRRVEELEEHGFKRTSDLFVPFSNGEEPANQPMKDNWHGILKRAEQERIEIHEEECASYAYSKGVMPLDEDFLNEHCIRIPMEGLTVVYLGGESHIHHPRFDHRESIKDYFFRTAIGTYSINNGVVAFIDNRGREYIMPGYDKLDTLERYGYKPYQMLWVLLSNGEKLADPKLAAKWQAMKAATAR